MGIFSIFRKKKDIEENKETIIEEKQEVIENEPVVDSNVSVDDKPDSVVHEEETVNEVDSIVVPDKVETYETIMDEYKSVNDDYMKIWDSCAREGLPYSEMLYRTTDIRAKMLNLSRKMRMKQAPKIKYPKELNGTRYKFSDFIDMCVSGTLVDNDGFGLYAARKGVSDIEVYPSDITENMYRKDFTHVVWFNK